MKTQRITFPWYAVLVQAFMMCLLAAAPLVAQSGSNTGLRGVVTDATGGLLPKVTVTITRTETGETRNLITNDAGLWEARFISPGSYQIILER